MLADKIPRFARDDRVSVPQFPPVHPLTVAMLVAVWGVSAKSTTSPALTSIGPDRTRPPVPETARNSTAPFNPIPGRKVNRPVSPGWTVPTRYDVPDPWA